MAVYGAMRKGELYGLMPEDVQILNEGNEIDVKITKTKTHTPRAFKIISNKIPYVKFVLDYIKLAAQVKNQKAFFMAYSKGKCTSNRLGINTFAKAFEKVATFLKLDSPKLYTGHAGRRTSATALVANRGSVLQLQKLGGWKSVGVAQGYVEESEILKRDTAELIMKKEDQPQAGPSHMSPGNIYNNCIFNFK